MAFLSKVISVPVGVTVGLLGAALVVAARVMPKCMHDEKHYSFPQVPRGKYNRIALRTCNICGNIKPYDWEQMRFISKQEMENIILGGPNGSTPSAAAVV